MSEKEVPASDGNAGDGKTEELSDQFLSELIDELIEETEVSLSGAKRLKPEELSNGGTAEPLSSHRATAPEEAAVEEIPKTSSPSAHPPKIATKKRSTRASQTSRRPSSGNGFSPRRSSANPERLSFRARRMKQEQKLRKSSEEALLQKATHTKTNDASEDEKTSGPNETTPGPAELVATRNTIGYVEKGAAGPVPVVLPSDMPSETPKTTGGHPLAREALSLIETCKTILRTDSPAPSRGARLHYEIARLYEGPLHDLMRASRHYQQALQLAPESLSIIRGARRTLIAQGKHQVALELFDAEARITSDPHQKAYILLAKGRLLEDALNRRDDARKTYAIALELDRGDATILKAVEQCDFDASAWNDLDETYERSANAVSSDVRHRAALVIRRAQLSELQHGNPEAAAELYEVALRLDPSSASAVEALKRLHHQHRRFRDLIRVLEIEAEHSSNGGIRTLALLRIAHIHAESLGNRNEAIHALERAVQQSPNHAMVLEELAELYEASERYDSLISTLERLAEVTDKDENRVSILHRIGQLQEDKLEQPEASIAWYEAALAIEPSHTPVLQALGKIYADNHRWDELIRMHSGDASHTQDASRRAAAYARMAELFESKLNRVDAAIEHHKRALSAVPSYEPSFKSLSRLYAQTKRWRELVELYEREVDISQHQRRLPARAITYLFKVGGVYEDCLDDFVQAAHAYRRVLVIDPHHVGALHALQRATERAGRFKELVEALELEAEKSPESSQVAALLCRAGEVLDERLGDRDASIAKFRRVLSVDPKYQPALSALGRLYHRAGRWENLLEMYRRELELTPRGAHALSLLTKMAELCEERIGREDEAVAYYRRAIDIDPSYRPALQALARRMEERESWEELIDILELELKSCASPQHKVTTGYRLGLVYEQHVKRPERAITAYRQVLESMQGYRPAVDGLCRLYTEKKEWRALVDLLSADAMHTPDPNLAIAALVREGEIWADKLLDPARAADCYSKVLERKPNHIGALLALEVLYRRVASWGSLAEVYERQAEVISDVGARVAALRELARLQESQKAGNLAMARKTFEAILRLVPNDLHALESLEGIALQSQDDELLLQISDRLAEISDDPAEYYLRVAECLEATDSPNAIDGYRKALRYNPDSLAATRGFSRIAEKTDDPEALAEAARREADVARDGEVAARLLVRGAALRLERLGDREGALTDLERALELWPDHRVAADRLVTMLRVHGQEARLAELLAKAAGSAKSAERVATLWMEVASLQSERLENVAAAVSALNRVLRTSPAHLPTLQKLGDLYEKDGQWNEAVQIYKQVVQVTTSREALCRTHMKLAGLWDDRLGDLEMALRSLQAVLGMDPEHYEALGRLADIQGREGRLVDAAKTAAKMIRIARSNGDKANALIRLARTERAQGHVVEASKALWDAVALEGPGGEATRDCEAYFDGLSDWRAYFESLSRFLREPPSEPKKTADTYIEMARVQADKLGELDAAVRTLEKGLQEASQDSLRLELALRQRQARNFQQAIWHLQYLLAVDPSSASRWRHLAETFFSAGVNEEGNICLEAIVMLDEATDVEKRQAEDRRHTPSRLRPGSFHSGVVEQIASFSPAQKAAAELLRVLEPSLVKLHPPDLESFGLTSRDKLSHKEEHPIRDLVEPIADLFDVADLDIYVHRARNRGFAVEFGSPAALLVPAYALERPSVNMKYRIAYHMANLSLRLHAFDKLMPRELEVLLAAAGRRIRPDFGRGLTSEEYLDDLNKRIIKCLPRRLRKELDEVAAAYVEAQKINFSRWAYSISRNAVRCASTVADSVLVAVRAIQSDERELLELRGDLLLRSSPLVLDLMRFWGSDKAMKLRRHIGILPARTETGLIK